MLAIALCFVGYSCCCYVFDCRIVWIFVYYNSHFPEDYQDPWCAFTHKEVFTIKMALRGSLQMGISDGMGETYNSFLDNFITEAEGLTGYREEYESTRRFTQTSYLTDTLSAMAEALDQTVKKKGKEWNMSLLDISLSKQDRQAMGNELSLVNSAGGNTGTIGFSSTKSKRLKMFAIRNFAPINNTNFSVELAYEENPWELFTAAVLVQNGGNVTFNNQNRNGSMTNESTIVFADGTTIPPLPRPFRFYKRGRYV